MVEKTVAAASSVMTRIESVRLRVQELERLAAHSPEQNESLILLHELRAALEDLAASEAALQESAARTRAIVETAVDGIITIDERGIVQSFNPAAERIFGYRAVEVIGQNVRVLMPGPDRDQHDIYIGRYLATGEKRIIGIGREVVGARKDGALFPLDLAVAETRLTSGRLFTGIVRDITDRKRVQHRVAAQSAISQALAISASLADATPGVLQAICAGFAWDLGELWDVDPTIARLRWGGMWSTPSFHPDGFAEASRETTFAIADGLPGRAWAADRAVWLTEVQSDPEFSRSFIAAQLGLQSAMAFPLHAGGNVIGVIALFSRERRRPDTDLLATFDALGRQVGEFIGRKRAETLLRDLEKLSQQRERLADIGAITAKLAHDLGNPLAGVSMQAQLILRRVQRDPDQPLASVVNAAEQIVTQVGRLDTLTKDLMSFAREQRLEIKTIDVSRFFQELLDFWGGMIAGRRIALHLEIAQPGLELGGDEEKLRRVFDNLVKNAVEAIDEPPGEIRLAVVPKGEMLRVSVTDTGCGIPESVELFRLFETTKPQGTGLGLAIAKQIVTAHAGRIDYARLAGGTMFTVELPFRSACL